MFISLIVGRVGISGGVADMGMGGRPLNVQKRWYETSIRELARAMNKYAPVLIEGHGDPWGKPQLGEITSAYTEQAEGGELEAKAIGYVSDAPTRTRVANGELSAASIQGSVGMTFNDAEQMYDVESVSRIEAVGLADAKTAEPGFKGAGIVAVVQELMQKGDDMDLSGKNPSDVFTVGQLLSDPTIKLHIQQSVTQATETLTKVNTGLAEKIAAQDKTITDYAGRLKAAGAGANADAVNAAIGVYVAGLKRTPNDAAALTDDLALSVKVEDGAATPEQIAEAVKGAGDVAVKRLDAYKAKLGPTNGKATAPGYKSDKGTGGTEENDPFLKANPLPVEA